MKVTCCSRCYIIYIDFGDVEKRWAPAENAVHTFPILLNVFPANIPHVHGNLENASKVKLSASVNHVSFVTECHLNQKHLPKKHHLREAFR